MSADWTLIFPAVTGLALTLQGAASGHLTASLGRGPAGVWTVTSSSVIGVLVWMALTKGHGEGTDYAAARLETPWWAYLGGFLGGIYVISMTSLVRRLGAGAFFLVCVVFQLATGTVMDHFGMFYLAVQPATAGRLAGLLVAGLGVTFVTFGDGVVAMFAKKHAEKDVEKTVVVVVEGKTETVIGEKPPAPVSATKGLADPAIAIAAISGVCISFQTGMNGAMGKTSYGPSFATLYSLITANVAMILFMLFDAYVLRHPIDVSKYKQVPWFGWLSGCLGFTYVMCVTFLTLRLGAANLLGVNVAMQVVSAMVFDHFGWMGFTVRKLTFVRGAGAVLVVGGVIMITLLR